MDDEPIGGADESADDRGPAREIIDLPWDDDMSVALGDETDIAEGAEIATSRDDADDILTDGEPTEEALHRVAAEAEGADDDAVRPGGDGGDVGPTDDSRDEDYLDEADDLGGLSDDRVAGRRNALPRRVESWRSRSATGAIATAIAMGLQQVFEPERRRPAAVAEAPSDPYSDDDPITVDYVPDDAEATTVHVKPWLLHKGDPT